MGAVGEDLLHGVDEDFPLVGGVEIVAHEEAAAQQVLAEFGDLRIGEFPVADFDGVEPGVVEHVVVSVQIDGLLDAARADAGEAADGGGEVAVGARVVDGPVGIAFAPVEAAAPTRLPVQIDAGGGVHEAREGPFAGLAPVRRKGEIVIFPGRVLAEWALREQRAHE